jgi:hypothetical protein
MNTGGFLTVKVEKSTGARVAASVFLMLCASVLAGSPPLEGSAQAARLNRRIGPADSRRYNAIRVASDWENPYLVIRPDGIAVIAKGIVSGRKTVSSADLEQTLIELPLTAWPYGRVVAVQDISIFSGARSDDELIAKNREAALSILKRLRVEVERWPA